MTTAIAFSRQNNTGLRGRTTFGTRSRPRLRIYIVKVCILARHGIFLTALRNKPKLKKKGNSVIFFVRGGDLHVYATRCHVEHISFSS